MAEQKPSRLLTLRKGAERLGGRHPRTITRWADQGILKVVTIAKRKYIPESEVDRLNAGLANGTVPAE